MADPYWGELDYKEKSFCSDLGIQPEDYVNLKRKMFEERAKNKKLTQELIQSMGKDFRSMKDKLPKVFDFWVKTWAIQKQ